MRFPSVQPPIQNYRLNLAYADCNIDEWNGIEGAAPDIAFLKMPEVNGRNLEAIGAVFYNLGLKREFTRSDPGHRMAICHAVVGVVGEWTEEPGAETTGLHRKVTVGGLFGNAKDLREFKEGDVDLAEIEIDYAAGLKRPKSHGGVSGGALWELNVELDQQLNTIAVKKRLLGVAFRESCDRRRITCSTPSSINAIAERIIAKWPEG